MKHLIVLPILIAPPLIGGFLQEVTTGSPWLDYAIQQGPMGVVAAGIGYLYWTARKEHAQEIKDLRAEIAKNQERHSEEMKAERLAGENKIGQLQAAWREERISLYVENSRLRDTHAEAFKGMAVRVMDLAEAHSQTSQQTIASLTSLREALDINQQLTKLLNSNHK